MHLLNAAIAPLNGWSSLTSHTGVDKNGYWPHFGRSSNYFMCSRSQDFILIWKNCSNWPCFFLIIYKVEKERQSWRQMFFFLSDWKSYPAVSEEEKNANRNQANLDPSIFFLLSAINLSQVQQLFEFLLFWRHQKHASLKITTSKRNGVHTRFFFTFMAVVIQRDC